MDVSRQWFKARVGLEVSETHRDVAFCSYVLLESAPDVLIVHDATQDPRFSSNPLVLGFPHIRFYAGAPLRINNIKIGTLCVIDQVSRGADRFGEREALMLQDVARPWWPHSSMKDEEMFYSLNPSSQN
jgi:GAF domain-containing protein